MVFIALGFLHLLKQNPKCYIPRTIKSQVNLVLADWAVRAILKITAIFLKYPFFEGALFHIFMGKQIQT